MLELTLSQLELALSTALTGTQRRGGRGMILQQYPYVVAKRKAAATKSNAESRAGPSRLYLPNREKGAKEVGKGNKPCQS